MLYISIFLTVTLFVFGLLSLTTKKNAVVQERLNYFLLSEQKAKDENPQTQEKQQSFYNRIIKPIFLDIKKHSNKRISGEKEEKLDLKLQKAGNPFGMTPVDFRLLQTACLFILPSIFGGYAFLLNVSAGICIIFVLFGFLSGLFLPNHYLKMKTKTRSKMALREFPDILDLLTVSLEAGLGFDAAITKVVSKKEGVLIYEFQRCLEEIRIGKTRREALSGIRDRLDVDVIRAFISSILQAEKLGIGMVRVLRVQSNEVREQRKQRAEETAMKAPIKMLFPLILFIFPSLFIVLLGPAILQIIETFKNS
ncbi:type II secretion system F family protein [Neobacillus drentensis]|uniref:type II secretion system F family protein n=1 Tax=Neobacillus drentensis TaxID=220684 RepID=UPI002FFEAD4F